MIGCSFKTSEIIEACSQYFCNSSKYKKKFKTTQIPGEFCKKYCTKNDPLNKAKCPFFD